MNVLRKMGLLALVFGVTALALSVVRADDKKTEVNVGDKAPEFKATDDAGNAWKSADHVGKKILVVYFFPADFTGGCTAQAKAFRDDYDKLKEKGVEVIGISGDSAKTHALFKKEHKLPFTLLADEDGSIGKQFGVPVGKGGTAKGKDDGNEVTVERGCTIQRWTFVIDKDGKVIHKDNKVNAANDSKKVLEVIEKAGK
jgi:peroxiredoxin Q/BCP